MNHECKSRLNEDVCNSKLNWNHDECLCEHKQLNDWNSCKTGYMQNPCKCDCECNQVCEID